jgi:hypothetical protein
MLRNYRYLHLNWCRRVLSQVLLLGFGWLLAAASGMAQSANSGSVEGVVKDPSGSSIAAATVEISNPVSGYTRTMGPFVSRTCRSIPTIW